MLRDVQADFLDLDRLVKLRIMKMLPGRNHGEKEFEQYKVQTAKGLCYSMSFGGLFSP